MRCDDNCSRTNPDGDNEPIDDDATEEDAIDELVAKFGEPREGTATVAEDKQ